MSQERLNAPGNPEIRITGVEVSEYRSGIPLKGWENVESALRLYETGAARSRTAFDHDVKEYGDTYGGLGAALFLLGSSRGRESFVDQLLKEARPSVQDRGQWSRHYDYDGPGRFHKTSVEIKALPNTEDGYLLGLNAAYVGKEVEDGLAETLGVEQGLQWKGVTVTLQPDGRNFRIDFNQIAQRLQSLYGELQAVPEASNVRQRLARAIKGNADRPALTGEAILRNMLTTDKYGGDTNPFVLGVTDGVEVSLNLGRVGDRFNWRNGNREQELWQTEGTVLTGPLAESYERRGESEPPSINFTIRRYSEDRYDRLPAIDPQMKAKMNELASRVASAFN